MAPKVLHANTSRTRIGVQSALGTASTSMRDIEILGGTPPLATAAQRTQANTAQTRRRREARSPVRLTRDGAEVAFTTYVKAVVTPLTADATPVPFDDPAALSHQVLFRMGLGGEVPPSAGSTVTASSGTPVAQVTVDAGHGSRFTVGSIVKIVRAAAQPWIRRITAISSDTLTLHPPLDAAPDLGAAVCNLYVYFPAEQDSKVFTLDHVPVEYDSATAQKRAIGVHGGIEWKLENGAAAEAAFKGTCVDWQGPADLSISDDPVADDMAAPMVWSPTFWLASSFSGAPSVAEDVATLKLSVPRKWQNVPGGVINGIGSVHEVAGRDEPITLEIESLFDAAWWTRFANDSRETLVAYTCVGTGADARVFGIWVPRAGVVEAPTSPTKDALLYAMAKLVAFQDTTIAGATPALSVAGVRTANVLVFLG